MVPDLATKDDPMTKLSDTQVIILSAAAQRPDGNVLPLPGSLRGGAATKVVAALLARGLHGTADPGARLTPEAAPKSRRMRLVWAGMIVLSGL